MALRIVNPRSVSFESVLADLKAYKDTFQDRAWRDFYANSTGTVLLDELAGVTALLRHDLAVFRRENFMDTLKWKSSATHLAGTLGYPVNRRSAPKLRIVSDIPANLTGYLPRTERFGSFGGRDLVLLRSQNVLEGLNTFYCALGEWRTVEVPVTQSRDFLTLLVQDDSVENDLEFVVEDDTGVSRFDLLELHWALDAAALTLTGGGRPAQGDWARIPLKNTPEDMSAADAYVKTYPDGVALAFGDGLTFGFRPGVGTVLRFTYLSSEGLLPSDELARASVGSVSAPGSVQSVDVLYPGANGDTVDKMKAVASRFHATRRRMVTAEDHVAILQSYAGVASANARKREDVDGCDGCVVEAAVLFDDKHLMDESTTDPVREGTITLTPETVVYEGSTVYPSSVRVGDSGFAASLVTGAKVWLEFESVAGGSVPQGLQNKAFYYVIRIPETRHIRFATTRDRALQGAYIQLYAPASQVPLNAKMRLSLYLDTVKVLLTPDKVTYGNKADYASSVNVGVAEWAVRGQEIRLDYGDAPARGPSGLTAGYYFALPVPRSTYLRLATTEFNAQAQNRIPFLANPDGNPTGTMVLRRLWVRESLGVFGKVVLAYGQPGSTNQEPGDPGYLDLSENANAAILRADDGTPPPAGTAVRVFREEGAHFPAAVEDHRLYYLRVDGTRLYLAETPEAAKSPDPAQWLTLNADGADPTPFNGLLTFEVFRNEAGGEGSPVEVDLAAPNALVFETAFTEADSVDLGPNPYRYEGTETKIWRGMALRLHSDSAAPVLPVGLSAGRFYYAIPVEGTNRLRFALTAEDAYADTDERPRRVPLSAPATDPSGSLLLDLFSDAGAFALDPDNTYFQTVTQYLSSVNVGPGFLTGGTARYPYGVETGTKVKLSAQGAVVLPQGLSVDEPFYLIRVPGTRSVRFARTRANALSGFYTPLTAPPAGSTVGGTLSVKAFGHPEEDALRAYVDRYKVLGERLVFVDPKPLYFRPAMIVVIDGATDAATVEGQIAAIVEKLLLKLATTIYIGDVIREITALDGVRRVYNLKPTYDRVLDFDQYLDVDGYYPQAEDTGLTKALCGAGKIEVTTDYERIVEASHAVFTDDGYSLLPRGA